MIPAPPLKSTISVNKWSVRKKFQIKHLPQYLLVFLSPYITKAFKLHPNTIKLIQRSFELGNPSQTIWPSDVMPMVSRLVAGGVWNYSFFQFHRHFYFPFWAQQQYNPKNESFIPRSHNILSMNQSHRNWVSISFPGKLNEVSVDPALAIMPSIDLYTIEFATIEDKKLIRPHDDIKKINVSLKQLGHLKCEWNDYIIHVIAKQNGVHIYLKNQSKKNKNIIFSIRPFNMEGASLLEKISIHKNNKNIEGDVSIIMKHQPSQYCFGSYFIGDSLKILEKLLLKNKKYDEVKNIKDRMGLANASFYFENSENLDIFIEDKNKYTPPYKLIQFAYKDNSSEYNANSIWKAWFPQLSTAHLPNKYNNLYHHVTGHILTLWDFNSITPGSFTYHHFWIRDAAVILYALLRIGGEKAVREILYTFKYKVSRKGLFKSQAGEWDANGQALWIIGKYVEFTKDFELLKELTPQIYAMLGWIKKMIRMNQGVLPPGFSAEHLGVADWYLWDNFWTLGGIQGLIKFQNYLPKIKLDNLYHEIQTTLDLYLKNYKYYPAALGRRKDAGMIGSISAIYPLNLPEYFNEIMLNSLKIIKKNYFFEGGFFQDNIHSGINPYLTLQVAESFLKLGKTKQALKILGNIFKWISVGYSFPEAVHPTTKTGCMGDGFHGWAFAETILLIQNLFLLELPSKIIFLAGIPEIWFQEKEIKMNNIFSQYGIISISIENSELIISGIKTEELIQTYIAIPNTINPNKIKAISGVSIESLANHLWSFDYGDRHLIKINIHNTQFKIKLD